MSTEHDTAGNTLQIDEVVVAWKSGEAATAALEWTLERVERLKATLTLVAVTAAPSADAAAELEQVAADVRARLPQLSVTTRALVGDAVQQFAALTEPGTLVVVGTDRRRGLSLKYSFSFGTKLAARARGPLALIPHGDPLPGRGVVVGVDGTEASLVAARLAAQIAASRGDELIVAHIWQEPTPWQDAYMPPDDVFLESLQKVHQDVLDQSVAKFAEDFPGLSLSKRLVHGLAPWGLLDQAQQASLLVVGTHGKRGIQRFLLGSVSHTILLNLEGPTIVVPQR